MDFEEPLQSISKKFNYNNTLVLGVSSSPELEDAREPDLAAGEELGSETVGRGGRVEITDDGEVAVTAKLGTTSFSRD